MALSEEVKLLTLHAFSEDRDEARKILNPSLVEHLTALAHTMGGYRIRLAFYDAQVFVMLPLNNDLFQAPSVLHGIGPSGRRTPVLSEIWTIEEMADTLHRQVTAGD